MQSMDEIYQQYAKNVYRYLMSLCRDSELAEEMTQETFYQAMRHIDKFDGSCKISTWLCAIAKNQLFSHYRKQKKTESLDDEQLILQSVATVPSAESEALSEMGYQDLMKRLYSCPEPFREVLCLRIFGNLSFREIGDSLGRSENWARVTYYRGKERLRKEMEEDAK